MNDMNCNEMKNADIRTVDKSELVNIDEVRIDINDKPEKKIRDYIRQIKNPYCFMCDGYAVKLSFTENNMTVEDCFAEAIESLI